MASPVLAMAAGIPDVAEGQRFPNDVERQHVVISSATVGIVVAGIDARALSRSGVLTYRCSLAALYLNASLQPAAHFNHFFWPSSPESGGWFVLGRVSEESVLKTILCSIRSDSWTSLVTASLCGEPVLGNLVTSPNGREPADIVLSGESTARS